MLKIRVHRVGVNTDLKKNGKRWGIVIITIRFTVSSAI